ncbi:MAG: CBS domain-containing protein [Chloroflexota bacterium]
MTIEQDLKLEQVIHLDLSNFSQVISGTSVRETIDKMRQELHNAAIVIDAAEKPIGIFTDRDVLRKIVDSPDSWNQAIDTVMTPNPITVNSTDPAIKALELMDEKHFRNVPVLGDDGKVIGNLTHYALIKYLADRFPESVYNLPPDPDHVSSYRDGA